MRDRMSLAHLRRVASRYMLYRARVEESRCRPHVARSERYVAAMALAGHCDGGQTMRKLHKNRPTLSPQTKELPDGE